jgi:SAM-dependent methyltransferase
MRPRRSSVTGLRAARWRADHGGRPLPEDDRDGREAEPGHAHKARFIAASVEEADLADEIYDKVFAVHVAALHKPGKALDTVRRRLAPGGRLCLFSQAPGWKASEQAEGFGAALGAALEESGFEIEESLVKGLATGFAAAVVAQGSR